MGEIEENVDGFGGVGGGFSAKPTEPGLGGVHLLGKAKTPRRRCRHCRRHGGRRR
jgi:hypothetical protein